ncbi:MAG: GtrA family protein [Phenylobacterium sp.]|nr:MAG: GtrA family protein [Phenylobacterium sp.]
MSEPGMSEPAAGRVLVRQGGTFLVVGLAATAVHALCSLAARDLGHLSAIQSTFVGYVCSVGVSYLGNARFTFGRPALHGAQFAKFLVVSLIGLGANLGITWLFANRLGWPFPAALAVVVVVIPVLSFAAAKLWAFADRR